MSKDNKNDVKNEGLEPIEVDSLSVKQFGDESQRLQFLGDNPKQGHSAMIGTISGTVVKTSSYMNRMKGISQTRFNGKFGIVNMDGERYVASKCYIPTAPSDELELLFLTGDKNPIDFKVDIEIVADASSPKGYRYSGIVRSNSKPVDPFNNNL